MTTQHGRTAMPPTDRRPGPSESTNGALDAVPGLLEDIALAAAKIYYLTAGSPGQRRHPSTVER